MRKGICSLILRLATSRISKLRKLRLPRTDPGLDRFWQDEGLCKIERIGMNVGERRYCVRR